MLETLIIETISRLLNPPYYAIVSESKIKGDNMEILIKGTDHHYIDELGNVRNAKTNHYIKPWINVQTGYPSVSINEFNKATNYTIHSLLAVAFIPNPYNKKTVNHKDGIKTNNSLSNLEWATNAENIKHAYDHALNHQPHKLEEWQIAKIYKRFMQHETFAAIRKDYDISAGQLSYWINKYVTKHNLTQEYKYELKYQKDLRQCKQPQRLSERSTLK